MLKENKTIDPDQLEADRICKDYHLFNKMLKKRIYLFIFYV